MDDVLLTDVPSMSINKVAKILSNAYNSIINKGLPISTIPSVMLWGAPGVGKSQGVRQIAEEIESGTSKKVKITDVRLLLYNPVDLRGIPTSNIDKTLAIWLKPQVFNMDPSENVINILFLDEISSAPQSVQAAAYQITLDKTIGEHKLPDNCIVIAAGNRVTDKSVAYKMPKALANRLMHFEICSNFDAWKMWAIEHKINEKVIGFISFKRNRLMTFDSSEDDIVFATPRSWELVSNILNSIDDTQEHIMDMVGGIVGMGTAIEFKTWMNIYNELPSIEDIFSGKCNTYPKSTDTLFALSSSLVAYVREHKNDMEGIINSINYCRNLPIEYSIITLRDYLYIDKKLKIQLLKTKEYSKWIKENGEILNGIVNPRQS